MHNMGSMLLEELTVATAMQLVGAVDVDVGACKLNPCAMWPGNSTTRIEAVERDYKAST